MDKKTSLTLLAVTCLLITALAACTRPLPGPSPETATASPTARVLILSTATPIEPTRPFPTQVQPDLPTPGDAAPTLSPLTPPTAPPPLAQPLPTVAAPPEQIHTVAALAPDVPARYKLQKGEFPFCIARRYDLDPYQLLRYNGLAVHQVFRVGLVLRIPPNPQDFPWDRSLRHHPAEYTVRRGDTLASIACRYGDVDPNAIALLNGLSEEDRLRPGQTLQIP